MASTDGVECPPLGHGSTAAIIEALYFVKASLSGQIIIVLKQPPISKNRSVELPDHAGGATGPQRLICSTNE